MGSQKSIEFGLRHAGSLGGKARAKSLSKSERSAIARQAAMQRWGTTEAVATHTGTIELGGMKIPCAVLTDGTRVLTTAGFMRALGRAGNAYRRPGNIDEKLPPFLAPANLRPFVSSELASTSSPVSFQLGNARLSLEAGGKGPRAYGYRADMLPKVCEVYLKARDAGVLLRSQVGFAQAADVIMRGLAHVGIVALVDEATGYQSDRSRDALAKILEAFIAKELRPWARTFQPEFYQELLRLRGLTFDGSLRQPRYVGNLTNDIVYRRLAPGVLDELKRINPANDKGQRRHKHFQWLSQHTGYQKLLQHLAAVTALMKIFDTYDDFKKALDKALPPQIPMPLFDQPAEQTAL